MSGTSIGSYVAASGGRICHQWLNGTISNDADILVTNAFELQDVPKYAQPP